METYHVNLFKKQNFSANIHDGYTVEPRKLYVSVSNSAMSRLYS
jgi:hypothetical protein